MADIYSIGVLAWKLFNGFDKTLPSKVKFTSLPTTHEDLQNIFTKCLEKEPWKRPSIKQIIEELEKANIHQVFL